MSTPQMNNRLLDTVRAWMVRRSRVVPIPDPVEEDLDEVIRAGEAADDAALRFRRSFADLEAEVFKRRHRRL